MSAAAPDQRALRLERLHVRRAPGIPDGFELRFEHGVVIVVGPNGSGKTTAARAMEAALWPDSNGAGPLAATAHYALDGARWRVDVDGARVRAQRDGVDAAPPAMTGAATRHRYRLPLHELLTDQHDGHDFAARIIQESHGGYDLQAASRTLGLTRPGPRSGQQEQAALRAAQHELDAVTARQRDLAVEFESLDDLHARLAGARAARERAAVLELAITHARARGEHVEAATALAAFDGRMANLAGGEPDRLATLHERRSGCEQRIAAATRAMAECDAAMELALPHGELPDTLMPALAHEVEALRSLESRLESTSRLAEAEAACSAAREALKVSAADERRLLAIDLAGMDALDDLARDSEQLRADRGALEAESSALADAGPTADAEAVRRGVSALEGWLTAAAPAAGDRRRLSLVTMLAAVAIIACGVIVGASGGPAAWVIVALAVLVLVLAALDARGGPDGRAAHEEEYRRLGFPAPEAWTVGAVSELLQALRRRSAEAELASVRAGRRAGIAARLADLGPRAAAIESRRAALVSAFGVAPATGPAALAWLAERVARWRAAHEALMQARASARAERDRLAAMRAALSTRLAPFGFAPSDDTAVLAGAVAALGERALTHAEARLQRDAARSRRVDALRERDDLGADRAALLVALGLDESELHLLAEWTATLPSFAEARERATRADESRRRAAAALHAAASDADALHDAAEWELAAAREKAVLEAGEHDELVRQAADIGARVSDARRGDAASRALAEVTRCRQALADARERDMERAVGAALAELLHRQTRDAQRPAVFHRARELFLRVTHGRWRLLVDDGTATAFRAYDTRSDEGHALHELSSGTRVQLLLSVRLAFVELQEGDGPRLPLLLDETLGTSDDARAQAIIETVLDLAAASGRQLFYFTAQEDEAAKWRGILLERGVAADLIDLARCRRLAVPAATFTPAPVIASRAIPAVDGLTHAEYGRLLGLPAVTHAAGSAHDAHLWYVTDDLLVLHHLLSQNIDSWGALESFVELGAGDPLDGFPDAYARIQAASRALDAALRWARVGRGRRVDRQVLADSGAITGKFIDVVSDLAGEVDGDAARLVDLLEAGQVKSFRSKATEKLREHLLENGFMTDETPLAPAEIAMRTEAAVAAELDGGLLSREQLTRIVVAATAAAAPPGVPGGELPVAHPGFTGTAARGAPSDQH